MPTETELVNAALRKIGAGRVLDITDTVPSAGVAQDVYVQERDNLLRQHPWNFATARIELNQLTALPAFEYAHAYGLPGDFLRVVSVHDSNIGCGDLVYKIESMDHDGGWTQVILTDAPAVFLRYIRIVTDVPLMSPTFRQVLILRMARVFAVGVANSNSLYQLIDNEMATALREAKSTDAIEDYPERLPQGSWAQSRGAYGWTRGWPR